MKRGNIDKRRAEKRSAVGGVLLFGLFQLACAAGFGALGASCPAGWSFCSRPWPWAV